MTKSTAPAASAIGPDIEQIRADFPDWSIWRSDVGRWYGTRRTRLTPAQVKAGLAETVEAEDLPGLAEALAGQDRPS